MFYRILASLVVLSCTLSLFIPAVRAQVCTPSPSGLVAWYRGEGDVHDASGSGNHGFLGSAGIAAGHVSQAYRFTAQNQSAFIPSSTTLFPPTALTIEAWINPSDYAGCAGFYRIFHTVQTTIRGYVTFINCANGKLHGQVLDSSGAGDQVISNATIPTGVFTHFAMTWDGSNLRTYINGVLDNTVATTISAIGTNSDPLRIGNADAIGFIGRIDELSLYDRALASTEVSAIFNAGTEGKCLVPTAASVSIGGRILTPYGQGISRARVMLMDQTGSVRTTFSSSLGYYEFDEVTVGETYMLSIESKRYTFPKPTRAITPQDNVTDADFIATNEFALFR